MNGNEENEGYILVTPARNEEDNLLRVANAVINQTIAPRLWVIVDDGSTDRTPEIIQDLRRQHHWISSVRLPEHDRDIYLNYSEVCQKGFNLAVDYLDEKGSEYEFVGLVDADTVVEPQYFEKLIEEFKKDCQLGVASGCLFYERDGGLVLDTADLIFPRGTGRLWRKNCFFETCGYTPCKAPPDVISNVKAKLHGYRAMQFRSITAVQLRVTSGAEGIWAGYEKKGRSWYYMNAHPTLILMTVVYFSAERPRYRGIAFLLGYMRSFIERVGKIDDEEIRNYYWSTRPRTAVRDALSGSED
jgi:glycosyltransferase involved in cell wall biosynthesis